MEKASMNNSISAASNSYGQGDLPISGESSLFNEAYQEYRTNGATKKSAQLLVESHEEGDIRATYALATWHGKGIFYEKNLKKAASLLMKAAKSKHKEALHGYAICLEKGNGVKKNESKAFDYYVIASLEGNKEALKDVERLLYYGIGCSKHRGLAQLIGKYSKI
jgi:uncharacterized protein